MSEGTMGESLGNYLPIEGYGVIGNLYTAALVGRNGSIDWCCLPHLDSPSVLGALLDRHMGGRFRVWLQGNSTSSRQQYVHGTNILKTCFEGNGGSLTVTDFMPLWGNIAGIDDFEVRPEIRRLLYCHGAQLRVHLEWSPRLDYGRAPTAVRATPDGFEAVSDKGRVVFAMSDKRGELCCVDGDAGPVVRGTLTLRPGERLALVMGWDRVSSVDVADTVRLLDACANSWRRWDECGQEALARDWAAPWEEQVRRSALTFKLLAYAGTGAIAAAATTSLPESVGGVRNWDYRYGWIRDAAMTTQALISLGHTTDARQVVQWMEGESAQHQKEWDLRIMYRLRGGCAPAEAELAHWEGYRGSAPVRIGNGAAGQFQLETYGELLNTAYEMARRGLEFRPGIKEFLCKAADHACKMWREPDYGIWEMRSGPRHFTYSKVMAWVALDRALHLAAEFDFPGHVELWRREQAQLCDAILKHGVSAEHGAFVMAFDTDALDAANLRIPLLEFLPAADRRVQRTIDLTLERLSTNDLVFRYKTEDGLPGEEGAFGLCTFWLVDALALSGRTAEAERVFKRILARANHLGLFAEQFHPDNGSFLGNFPQAFTHIGLINSALYLACARGEEPPEYPPIGTPAHRKSMRRDAKP